METEFEPSEFDWLTLDADEEVLWADTPHPYSLVPILVVGIPLSLFVIGIPLVVGAYLSFKNTNYVVTSDALYKKTGVLSRNVQRIEFDKVQDTSYSQSFLGAQFGFGSVNISTAGGSGIEMSFQNVSEPQSLQTLVNERIKRRGGRDSESGGKAAVLDDILAELRAIRGAVEGGNGVSASATNPEDSPTDDAPEPVESSDFDFDQSVTDER
ncbi:PH domain-containing protein [Haloferax sp. MBLA0076]|uniref:PH domain-containing protein n=1 Tax=Haloferax litoreum TaxID=2666140 RepID=A0A6A8GMT8_9EURY|nr:MULTISPECIES: PH domain-containing protein [Haloferax]KAB1194509.1 PH domain-containing protein [Haloferax sp. CBA1148]MRX23080.1 PH domain-containing protein [Haloferax litoreum]